MTTWHTPAGSRATFPTPGSYRIEWDWLEEGACSDAHVSAERDRPDDAWVTWRCECHGTGQARLVCSERVAG